MSVLTGIACIPIMLISLDSPLFSNDILVFIFAYFGPKKGDLGVSGAFSFF